MPRFWRGTNQHNTSFSNCFPSPQPRHFCQSPLVRNQSSPLLVKDEAEEMVGCLPFLQGGGGGKRNQISNVPRTQFSQLRPEESLIPITQSSGLHFIPAATNTNTAAKESPGGDPDSGQLWAPDQERRKERKTCGAGPDSLSSILIPTMAGQMPPGMSHEETPKGIPLFAGIIHRNPGRKCGRHAILLRALGHEQKSLPLMFVPRT